MTEFKMTEFNYGDIIEYIDGTRDIHFEEARNWAYSHDTTFEELLDKRDLPKRYFQIGPEPEVPVVPPSPEPQPPTVEEMMEQVRLFRAGCFERYVDWYQSKPLLWDEMSQEEKDDIAAYRIYLKDYTNHDGWWLQNPLEYDEWLLTYLK
jgi:hypothetical protein